jgi:hypothetical protein
MLHRYVETQTKREQGDRITLLLFFENKEVG